MNPLDEIQQIYREIVDWYEQRVPPGAGDEEMLAAFEVRNGIRVPKDVRLPTWLCSGTGLYAVDATSQAHPVWKQKGWLPLGDDEPGDHYVLDTRCPVEPQPGQVTYPVYFLDHERDDDEPCCAVASSFQTWAAFMRRRQVSLEQGKDSSWPWDRKTVLEADPVLAAYRGPVPLPWEAD